MPLDLDKLKKYKSRDQSLVALLYCAIIHDRYGRRTFQKIAPGGKMENIANKLQELANERDIPLRELLEEAIGSFGVEFCQKTFGTPYPQINVVLTEKTLVRLRLTNRAPLRVSEGNLEETILMYMDAMKHVDVKTAIECVEGGWPEGHAGVRAELIRRLQRRRK